MRSGREWGKDEATEPGLALSEGSHEKGDLCGGLPAAFN